MSHSYPRRDLWAKWEGKVSMKLEDIDPQNPEHIAFLNAQGLSFLELSRIFGVGHTTAWVRCKAVRTEKCHYSIVRVLNEDYLQNRSLSERNKRLVMAWMNQNLERLNADSGKFLSLRQERDVLRREQSDKFNGSLDGFASEASHDLDEGYGIA